MTPPKNHHLSFQQKCLLRKSATKKLLLAKELWVLRPCIEQTVNNSLSNLTENVLQKYLHWWLSEMWKNVFNIIRCRYICYMKCKDLMQNKEDRNGLVWDIQHLLCFFKNNCQKISFGYKFGFIMGGADSIWKLYRKVSVQIFTVDINEKCNIIQNSEKGVGLLHRCQFMCEYLMIFSVEARKQTLGPSLLIQSSNCQSRHPCL